MTLDKCLGRGGWDNKVTFQRFKMGKLITFIRTLSEKHIFYFTFQNKVCAGFSRILGQFSLSNTVSNHDNNIGIQTLTSGTK